MTSYFSRRYGESELLMISRALEIGSLIHQRVADEGRREGVAAYLYHDGCGRAWFEKFDRNSGKVSRSFSPEISRDVREHVAELRIYAKWVEAGGDLRRVIEVASGHPPG